MTPTQVTVRFPAEAGRTWRFRPTATAPRAGAIVPRGWDVTPTVQEATDGTFEVALLATDEAAQPWAWHVRDPSNHRRVVAVPAASSATAIDYEQLPDVDPASPADITSPPVAAAPPAVPLEQTPLWLLDVIRDLVARQADLESRVGTPVGMTPIGTTAEAVDAYINGFINPLIGDYL